MTGRERRIEGISVHGRADGVCCEAGRGERSGGSDLPVVEAQVTTNESNLGGGSAAAHNGGWHRNVMRRKRVVPSASNSACYTTPKHRHADCWVFSSTALHQLRLSPIPPQADFSSRTPNFCICPLADLLNQCGKAPCCLQVILVLAEIQLALRFPDFLLVSFPAIDCSFRQ